LEHRWTDLLIETSIVELAEKDFDRLAVHFYQSGDQMRGETLTALDACFIIINPALVQGPFHHAGGRS
jgi:hypothetical protein